ncbi:class I SAM-dependent RNA methyltransferase [Qipengyuania aquimaris]|uniref:Class I SAM-dependent RNA methyltransferase n=1 Tax=Qipengyuania aquimaris TaxID=255984 RepID=A0A9Q3S0A9_9SPHN|nr:class I SAM-dependent RNA methyltransferase [Qipengyuania aquimaris]MBY6217617.1 class I SAM-dependent RNA methyltransferase [Qipengyuania aquimaris]
MSGSEIIERIAAKGDGVTASGRHVAGAVTGDTVDEAGNIQFGPYHQDPPCRHFGTCGGCQLQHADEEALRRFVTERVAFAAEAQGVEIGELLATHLSPARTRRRGTLHAMRAGKGAVLGFREARSNRIVDMHECHILEPRLFSLVNPLRKLVADHAGKAPVDISLTLADQGVDCSLKGFVADGLAATEAVLDFARAHRLSRLSLDQGYGAETVWEPQPVTITLGAVPVGLPQGAFLQPTLDGEEVLLADARSYLEEAGTIADLFAGLGTFAFGLAGPAKVLAVEAARDAHLACKSAANSRGIPVHAMHRDLFRNPLTADEISRFDGIVLDPPRAGARDQVAQIAQGDATRVAYISCNPSSWARDAKSLVDAGFRLEKLRPVGQFRWSTHVELTSYFTR